MPSRRISHSSQPTGSDCLLPYTLVCLWRPLPDQPCLIVAHGLNGWSSEIFQSSLLLLRHNLILNCFVRWSGRPITRTNRPTRSKPRRRVTSSAQSSVFLRRPDLLWEILRRGAHTTLKVVANRFTDRGLRRRHRSGGLLAIFWTRLRS